jgi:hypothetical protein
MFEVQHRYLAPPDPLNPTAPITITVTLMDDNGGTVVQSVQVDNPGINTFNVAIDTTPDVPRLAFNPQPPPPVLLDRQTAALSSLQSSEVRTARSEMPITADRYLELVVVSPDGEAVARYRLSDEALGDLRGLFRTLPDNRYQIFLVRSDNNSRRLVMDVFVRRGRVIDPTDSSEGTRDRPPTTEGTQQNESGPMGGAQQEARPLENNPLLKQMPADTRRAAANEFNGPVPVAERPSGLALIDDRPARTQATLRWAAPLAGLGLAASRESWSQRLGAALEQADDRAWQRLRRAGRLGNRRPIRGEKLSAAADVTE